MLLYKKPASAEAQAGGRKMKDNEERGDLVCEGLVKSASK